jgi:hypothetical protein
VKLDKRFAPVLNALLMAVILPFLMTFVVVLVNTGFSERFFGAWMRTWMIAAIAAFPLILLLAPLIRKVVAKLTA